MSDINVWLTIFLLALATFLTRTLFWLVGDHVPIPEPIQKALRFAPTCALAAILIPDFLVHNGNLHFHFTNPRLVAAVLSTLFFLKTRSMLGTMVFGMIAYTLARLALPI